jgi:hypothetical protein
MNGAPEWRVGESIPMVDAMELRRTWGTRICGWPGEKQIPLLRCGMTN